MGWTFGHANANFKTFGEGEFKIYDKKAFCVICIIKKKEKKTINLVLSRGCDVPRVGPTGQ